MPTVPDFERQQLHQYKLMAGGQCTYVHVVVKRIPQLLQQSGRPADRVSPRRTSCVPHGTLPTLFCVDTSHGQNGMRYNGSLLRMHAAA